MQEIKCTENVRGTVGMHAFNDGEAKLNILLALGSDASEARRAEAFQILNTLGIAPPQRKGP